MSVPRLPVFILIDMSGSMSGRPARILDDDLRLLFEVMRQDALIKDRVDVCLIGFGDDAWLMHSLAPVATFEFAMELEPAGATATGAAIGLMIGE